MLQINYFPQSLVSSLWSKMKAHVAAAVSALSSVYAAISHTHAMTDITDLTDATATKGGLLTDAQAVKLNGISAGAQVNVIETISVNGTDQSVSSKKVDIEVPTKTSDLNNDDSTVKDANYVHTDNNYSTTEKNKLGAISAGAQVNVIEEISVNGSSLTPSGKAVNITVPTNNNQLTNGAGYQTESQVSTLIDAALANITGIDLQIVAQLPQTGTKGVLYFVVNSGTGQNVYDEYVWVNNSFEKLGTREIDLSGYVLATELIPMASAQLDEVCV